MRKNGLCNNCFARGHLAKTFEMPSFCRVKGCKFKHSTFLHPKGNANEKKDNAVKTFQYYAECILNVQLFNFIGKKKTEKIRENS